MRILKFWLDQYPLARMCVWLQIALACAALVAMTVDGRRVLGLNTWVKPLKFDISIASMIVTFAAFMGGFEAFESVRAWLAGIFAVALTLENALISFQALRGVRSHMNFSTAFDARIFMVMGLLAVVGTVVAACALGLTFLAPSRWAPAVVWGMRLGLLVFLAGSVEGATIVSKGAHTVSAIDGLRGLPLLNWSRKHGDLRIAHFFGLHAVQLFPLFGYLCTWVGCSDRLQVISVFAFAIIYSAGVWFLFQQAMQGQPLL